MRKLNRLFLRFKVLCAMSILTATVTTLPLQAWAQTAGQNDVWKNSTTQKGSWAFIDASVFAGALTADICTAIYNSLLAVGAQPGLVAVIDARGININNSISDTTNKRMKCTDVTNGTPWYQPQINSTVITTPASILLPAGAIEINTAWVLPDRTRVFGEGMNSYGLTSGGNGTAITWTGGSTGPMIQFGGLQGTTQLCPTVNSAPVCTGVSLQDVYLYGGGQNIVGIENAYAQDLSYVDHVSLNTIGGTGLLVTANGSGPYSNLSCGVNATNSGDPMTCVELQASNTLGLHGMTATPSGNPPAQPAVAIYLDGSNNTIEDIHTEGFVDGIRIGQNAEADSNALLDVNAGDGAGNVTNAIHICGGDVPPSPAAACSSPYYTVKDLSIVGSLSVHVPMSGNTIAATLQDDVTGVWLEQPINTNTSSVGLYVLGESATIGTVTAYSRFTTSAYTSSPQITPTWAVGSGAPTTGAACSNPGSLYSNTSGGSGTTLYVCVPGTGTGTGWQPVV